MTNYQLQELKNMVSQLNLSDEFDNLESESCGACCAKSGGGVGPEYADKNL